MTDRKISASHHLMVVDDDPRVRTTMVRYLQANGYLVTVAENALQVRQKLSGAIDLVLLDIGLPDEDGLSLAREIRARSNVGIIIVSGRSDEVDRIVGLEVGADDYISKPFSLRELLARIKSVLRRTLANHSEQPTDAERLNVFRFDGWELNVDRRELRSPIGEAIPLTTGEFEMLLVLLHNSGRVLTREFLMDHTKGRIWDTFDRSIDAQITRLRRKLGDDAAHSTCIKSVRGVGYLFTPSVQKAQSDS